MKLNVSSNRKIVINLKNKTKLTAWRKNFYNRSTLIQLLDQFLCRAKVLYKYFHKYLFQSYTTFYVMYMRTSHKLTFVVSNYIII